MTTVDVAATAYEFRVAGRLIGESVLRGGHEGYGDIQLTLELADVADYYAAPSGCLLLGWLGGEPGGVCGVRRLNDTTAELRRLYVRPGAQAVHRPLVRCAVGVAGELGCAVLRLPRYQGRPYRDLGFVEVDGQLSVVLNGSVAFELDLPA